MQTHTERGGGERETRMETGKAREREIWKSERKEEKESTGDCEQDRKRETKTQRHQRDKEIGDKQGPRGRERINRGMSRRTRRKKNKENKKNERIATYKGKAS